MHHLPDSMLFLKLIHAIIGNSSSVIFTAIKYSVPDVTISLDYFQCFAVREKAINILLYVSWCTHALSPGHVTVVEVQDFCTSGLSFHLCLLIYRDLFSFKNNKTNQNFPMWFLLLISFKNSSLALGTKILSCIFF